MAVAFAFVLSLFCFLQLALRTHAAALTTAIAANERLCFYADVDKAGEKIGVRALLAHVVFLTDPDVAVLLCRTLACLHACARSLTYS